MSNRDLAKHSTLGTNFEADDNKVWARDTRTWEKKLTAWLISDGSHEIAVYSFYLAAALLFVSMIQGVPMIENIKVQGKTNILGFLLLMFSTILFASYAMVAKQWFPWEPPIGLEPKGKAPKDITKRGTFFLGEILQPMSPMRDRAVACFSKDKLVTHFFLFGSTGAGKTESIMSMGLNMLLIGSGFQMVDAKAQDKTLFAGMTLLRRFGREDDLYIINFIMGNKDNAGYRCPFNRDTHTFNPAVYGAGSSLSELFISLMPPSGGDNAVFQQRAEAFIKAAFRVLVFLRNRGDITASINTISVKMNALETVVDMSIDQTVDTVTRSALMKYIESLPGMSTSVIDKYKLKKKLPQGDHYKQHGFISMQLMSALSLFADDYGHIFNVDSADIDTYDTVINKRIMFVLIPALEKSGSSVQTLGKVIIAANKQMLAGLAGDGTLVGDEKEAFFPDPTEDILPYLSIQDEKAYYMVDQESVIPGQARSLNFCILYASQDYKKLSAENDAEASNMMQNTTTKLCLRQEDQDTLDVISKRVSEAYVSKVSSNETNGMGGYQDTGSASYERMSRLNILDFANLDAGQGVITHGDGAYWIQMMYAFIGLKKLTKFTFDFPRFIPGVIINDKVATAELRRKARLAKTRKVFVDGIKGEGAIFSNADSAIAKSPLPFLKDLTKNWTELRDNKHKSSVDTAFIMTAYRSIYNNISDDLIRSMEAASGEDAGEGVRRRRRRRRRVPDDGESIEDVSAKRALRASALLGAADARPESLGGGRRRDVRKEARVRRNRGVASLIDEDVSAESYPNKPAPRKNSRRSREMISKLSGLLNEEEEDGENED